MYSQKNEEEVILRIVGDHVGTFLDIGAYDGYHYSNTMALVERGWSGTMVEPGLEAFQALLARHGGNPNLTLIHAPIQDSAWELIRFWNNTKTFSTTSKKNRDRFIHEGFSQSFWVPAISIGSLVIGTNFLIATDFDAVSIDTEGTSVDLFKAYPLWANKPLVFCVEHDGRVDECKEFAAQWGYRLVMGNEENLIFAL